MRVKRYEIEKFSGPPWLLINKQILFTTTEVGSGQGHEGVEADLQMIIDL